MSFLSKKMDNTYQKKWERQRHAHKTHSVKAIIDEIDKYQFVLPIERNDLLQKCTENEKYAKALFRNKTKSFLRSCRQSVIEKSNIVGLINGYTNSGKSRMSQSILYIIRYDMLKLRGIDYKIYVVYDREDMQDVLKNEMPPFGLSLDEFASESGKDSHLKLEALKNISESIRIDQISIILCTPVKEGRGFINFRLYMAGTLPEKNSMRALLFYGDSQVPDGYIEIPFHADEEFFSEYMVKKLEFTKEIRGKGGYRISTFNRKKVDEHAQYFYKVFKSDYGTQLKAVGDIMGMMENEGMDGEDYDETENFKKRVAIKVRAKLLKDIYEAKKREKSEKLYKNTEFDEYSISKAPVLEWEDQEFKKIILKELEKDITDQDFEIFSAICDGESYRLIAARILNNAKVSGTVAKIKEKVQRNFLGYSGERAYNAYLYRLNKEYEYGGGATSEPDFINHTDKEVISLKTFTLPNDCNAKAGVAASEINIAAKLNYSCFLIVFTMQDATFRKYSVLLPEVATNTNNNVFSPPIAERKTKSTPFYSTNQIMIGEEIQNTDLGGGKNEVDEK